MIDTKKRNFMKAITWKILGFLVLSGLAYLITNSLEQMTYITIVYHLLMIVIYFVHERVWNLFPWGKTRGLFIQMTGLSGAGKSTLSRVVADKLKKRGIQVEILDGDEYRQNLCKDLGFSKEDRNENIRRLGFVSKVLERNNVVAIIAAINPYDQVRKELKKAGKNVKIVYIKSNLETVKKRDTKDLYRRAMLEDSHPEKVRNFTGISDPFDEPSCADLVIETDKNTITESAKKLENFILKNIQ
tara:strand:- start:198 stop:929 length:732 start_codon:yes stop_codon:yes gene_type:complete